MSYYRKKPVIIEARQYVGTASQTHDVYQVAESAIAELTGTGEGKASQVSREIWTRCEESHGLLCATTSRARGTAVALEAENARLTEALYLTRITLEATFRVLQEASGLPDDIDDPDCRDEMVLALRPRAEKAEAENARLREGIESMMRDVGKAQPAHVTPGIVAVRLKALLADTDSAKDEGGEG